MDELNQYRNAGAHDDDAGGDDAGDGAAPPNQPNPPPNPPLVPCPCQGCPRQWIGLFILSPRYDPTDSSQYNLLRFSRLNLGSCPHRAWRTSAELNTVY